MVSQSWRCLVAAGLAHGLVLDVHKGSPDFLDVEGEVTPPLIHHVPGDEPEQAPESAKNMLFIIADDMRPELGCYGHSFMKTPNLDRLAQSGTLFSSAYSQYAYCAPSRNSFMSGRRPGTTQVWNFVQDFRTNGVGYDWTSLPGNFKRHGYITLGTGKTFHPGEPYQFDYPYSWSFDLMPYGWGGPRQLVKRENSTGGYIACDGRTVVCVQGEAECPDEAVVEAGSKKGWCSVDTSRLPPNRDGTPKLLWDQAEVGLARERLRFAKMLQDKQRKRRQAVQPFFLAVGFHKPHWPWIAPKEFFDLYPTAEDLPPPAHPTWPMGAPAEEWQGKGIPSRPQYSASETIALRRAYYATISYVDSLIGELLAELESLGLQEQTAVVFTSDHGVQLGEFNLWEKKTNFELGVRVPLIIRAPWISGSEARRSNKPVELVDLYRTMAELAGISVPDDNSHIVHGESLVQAMQGEKLKERFAFSQFAKKQAHHGPYDTCFMCLPAGPNAPRWMGYSVRSRNWRWTEWFAYDKGLGVPKWDHVVSSELYDHSNDTGGANAFDDFEYKNLWDFPRADEQEARRELQRVLRKQFQE